MKKITQMLAGASMLVLAGSVVAAEEPMTLTAAQMDSVSAGAVVLLQGQGVADAAAAAIANLLGATASATQVVADPTGALTGIQQVFSAGESAAAAASVFNPGAGIGGAQAASAAAAASALF